MDSAEFGDQGTVFLKTHFMPEVGRIMYSALLISDQAFLVAALTT
jgi:hypothetical protein